MSGEKLKLEVLLAAIDKVTRPLKAITAGSNETARALKAAKDQLKELNAANDRIDAFRKVSKDSAITANQLKAAQQRLREVKQAMSETLTPSRELKKAFADARQEVSLYGMRLTTLIDKKKRLRGELEAAGVPLKDLKRHQGDLAKQIDAATAAVNKQTAAMKAQNEVAKRMHAARAAYDKTMANRQRMMNAGTSALAGGATIGLPVAKAAKDYATFEDAMLGVARQVEGARDDNGRLTATYYEMGRAIKEMGERIPMATTEIARIVEAGARMGIQGKENLLIYAQTAAVMAHAFDLPVDKLGEDIAKVAQLFKVPIKEIGALGDAINWLDDNALAKGGDIIEVMKRLGGTAAMVNMNFKEAAALGSTFLSLGAVPEVAASASNAMIRELSIATMQTKRFRGGLEMLKLDAKSIQFGMTKDATGTIIKVLEAIKALPQEKQLEAATRMFGKEFGDDAAKLASNLDEYRRQLKLVNDERARGSMQREGDARRDTINARLLMAKNAFFNLSSDLGETLRPAIVATMEKTLAVVQAVRAWAQENPRLASGIMSVVKWLAIGVTAIGGLLIVAAGVLAPLALLKFGLAGIGLTGGAAALTVGLFVAKAALIAGVFYAAWKAGEWLGEKLGDLVSRIAGYKTTLGGFVFDVIQMFKNGDWSAIGGFIVRGIEAGIDMLTAGLYSKVKGLLQGLVDAAKEKLGIKSPSRVFAEIGGFTMEGLEQGLLGGQGGPLGAVRDMARRMAAAGAGVLIGGSAMAGELPRIDTRAALSTMGAMASGGGAPMIVNITINAAPGMNETAIARQVAAELQRIEASRAARGRSRLRDAE
ncbi:MAG: phage tail tape measure protein [Denitratisoma sp.]|nr:phage tail tape measure protein [Denitratisoma sp.]